MKFKTLISIFVITSILSLNNIKASSVGDGWLSIANFNIPAMQGTATTGEATKNTISNQYLQSYGAIDSMSTDHRAIQARINGIGSSYVDLVEYQDIQLKNNGSLGQVPGNYKLQLKAKKWTVSGATFFGMWTLDSNLIGKE